MEETALVTRVSLAALDRTPRAIQPHQLEHSAPVKACPFLRRRPSLHC